MPSYHNNIVKYNNHPLIHSYQDKTDTDGGETKDEADNAEAGEEGEGAGEGGKPRKTKEKAIADRDNTPVPFIVCGPYQVCMHSLILHHLLSVHLFIPNPNINNKLDHTGQHRCCVVGLRHHTLSPDPS